MDAGKLSRLLAGSASGMLPPSGPGHPHESDGSIDDDDATQIVVRRDEMSTDPVLQALSKEFRENVKWSIPDSPSQSDDMMLSMVRLPNTEPDPGKDRRLVAVDRRAHKGPPGEIAVDAMADFWTSAIDYIRPSPPDWHKAGAVIWDYLGFQVDNDWTALNLGLKDCDDHMSRACQAALFGAFATGASPADLEKLLSGIATFVHAHPRLNDVTLKDAWHLPYGENTAYRVVGPGAKAGPTKPKVRHRP